MTFKEAFSKIKMWFDAYKMWVFFAGLLVSTNGAQMYANSEPEVEEVAPVQVVEKTIVKPGKTVVIHKVDNSYCDKLMNDHIGSNRH